MAKIHIVDAPMGSGKTCAAINYINNSPKDKKFIYVTPYLDEVDRIIKSCSNKHFYAPASKFGNKNVPKIQSLQWLLARGYNVVTTHALFHKFNETVMMYCQTQGYELIMDEVADVADKSDLSDYDVTDILTNHVNIGEDGYLHWREEQADDYLGRFNKEKWQIDNRCLVSCGDGTFLWLFPSRIFESFSQVFILTYMFEVQIQSYYYKYCNLDYDFWYVKGDNITDYEFTTDFVYYKKKKDYKNLITIYNDDKINQLSGSKGFLNWNWYNKKATSQEIDIVRKNLVNYFRYKPVVLTPEGKWRKCKQGESLWTTFKNFKGVVGKNSGVLKSFAPCSSRATNQWGDRVAVAYMVNRNLRPEIANFFFKNNIAIDRDGFALSEALQFIWRSAIRNDKHITVYIPSMRIRNLVIKWIDENSI